MFTLFETMKYKSIHVYFTQEKEQLQPYPRRLHVQTVGPRGPMLMQDVVYMDWLASASQRVVHAKGAGESRSSELAKLISRPLTITSSEPLSENLVHSANLSFCQI